MAEFRTVCLEDLIDRLRLDLVDRASLADRLAQALLHRDAERVAEAMEDLEQEPEAVRTAVHDAILSWLFGGDPAAGLRMMTPASPLAH